MKLDDVLSWREGDVLAVTRVTDIKGMKIPEHACGDYGVPEPTDCAIITCAAQRMSHNGCVYIYLQLAGSVSQYLVSPLKPGSDKVRFVRSDYGWAIEAKKVGKGVRL